MFRDWSRLTEILEQDSSPSVSMSIDDIARCIGGPANWRLMSRETWTSTATASFAWTQCGREARFRNAPKVVDFIQITGPIDVTPVAHEDVHTLRIGIEMSVWFRGNVVVNGKGKPNLRALGLQGPGVYCFTLEDCRGVRCYVGESENLTKRMMDYEVGRKRRRTDHKVHTEIIECLQSGGQCKLETIIDSTVDDRFMELTRASERRLLENTLLVELRRRDVPCINVDDFVLEDRFRRIKVGHNRPR